MKNKQTVFNQIVKGLIEQGQTAVNGNGHCQLRAQDGDRTLKCAVGMLIPDSEYNSCLEDEAYMGSINDEDKFLDTNIIPILTETLGGYNMDMHQLLADLQDAHDESFCGDLEERSIPEEKAVMIDKLKGVGRKHNLKWVQDAK